ncbi:hypothetical protein EE612_053254 [Oryza sativa]|nr:hypothetical protein EE612_053254 [Oryza sativa]
MRINYIYTHKSVTMLLTKASLRDDNESFIIAPRSSKSRG